MSNNLNLVWKSGKSLSIELLNNPAANSYWNSIKQLQHIDLNFDPRKNPLHPDRVNVTKLANQLITNLQEFNITVEPDQLTEQKYLNYLHEIYFSNANQLIYDNKWLVIHDLIHLLETAQGLRSQHTDIWFDYEKKAGPLITPFNRDWLQYATTNIAAGTCYIMAHELGKDPITYYRDKEPTDTTVMTKLMKPWVDFKPVMSISIIDQDRGIRAREIKDKFTQWFAPFKEQWTKHWNVVDWQYEENFSVIPIGQIENINYLIDCFKNQDYPIRITR